MTNIKTRKAMVATVRRLTTRTPPKYLAIDLSIRLFSACESKTGPRMSSTELNVSKKKRESIFVKWCCCCRSVAYQVGHFDRNHCSLDEQQKPEGL